MIYRKRHILAIHILLTVLLAGSSTTLYADGGGVVIKGSVFGGGNEGEVQDQSEVIIESGTIEKNVFGGGNNADVLKNVSVTMSAGTVQGNIYGGGNLGDIGTIDKTNLRAYAWTGTDGNPNSAATPYAETNTGVTHVTITGGIVGIDAALSVDHGNVFGGGKGYDETFWCEKGMVYSADVRVTNIKQYGSVYGGGELGRVETNTTVTIGPESGTDATEIKGCVFGAGKGVETHGYSALVRGNTDVVVRNGAKVDQNVYGGGEIASVGKYNVDSNGMPYSLANNGSGKCCVSIPGSTQILGDIFGGGKGIAPLADYIDNETYTMEDKPKRMTLDGEGQSIWQEYTKREDYFIYLQTLALATETNVTIDPGNESVVQSTKGNVYGGSENGIVQHNTLVTVQGKCLIGEGDGNGNIYGGGKGLENVEGAGQVNGDATVNINGGTMIGSIFGGGVLGATKGNVTVNINGGTVNHDVYGGGSYANTNTSNWYLYSVVTGLTVGTSPVTGYYERSFGGAYSLTTDEKAVEGKTYYTKNTTATWTDSEQKSALYTTHVNLRGGAIEGDVYGGALGDDTHEPYVYGNILVDLNGKTCTDGSTVTDKASTDKGCVVTQVFGCNNAKGTPKGDVLVHVYATQNKDVSKVDISKKFVKEDIDLSSETDVPTLKGYLADQIKVATAISVTTDSYQTTYDDADATAEAVKTAITGLTAAIHTAADTDAKLEAINAVRYDVNAVYGGGNKAAYNPVDPATNKTQVLIEGCEYTSIDYVYGGGNAAPVPSTEVTVNSAYEINTLFGGGNGKSTPSFTNPGADVGIINKAAYDLNPADGLYGTGKAVSKLYGGEIHVVYGGSNEKGNIVGGTSIEVDKAGSSCELKVGQIYGAGNNAEMDGGTDIVMGCMPAGVIEEIYAGARNADVAGDVKLTITSGTFGRVFGGNKHGGKLQGSITVNVEETGDCDQPLIIGELYGGGNLADYSIYGYKNTAEPEETPVWVPRESTSDGDGPSTPYADPKLNIRSFTSIGAVYGGGYRAMMVANPTVDINVVKGSHAATAHLAGTIEDIPLEKKNDSGVIVPDGTTTLNYPAHEAGKIGAIGNVFGGGNLAEIKGNATVNIGTETKIYFKTEPTQFRDPENPTTPLTAVAEGTYAGSYEATVEGAIIKGSVYGGGNMANITGNTQVNICAKYDGTASEYRRVAPGTAGVTIDHDVFGAGKGIASDVTTALVSGNTTIVMMGGDVKQSVYGGGELSQVVGNTEITVSGGTIGTPMDGETRYGGEKWGNIYGGGKGNTTNVRSGLIKGNTTITVQDLVATADNAEYYGVSAGTVVSSPTVLHNIYGGGAHGSVGTYTYTSDAADAAINGYTTFDEESKPLTGVATIRILGGTIGYDGHDNGMVFGSSRGDIDRPNTIYDNVAWVYSTNVIIGGEGYNPHIKGSVYGSGENGHTYQNASVAIHSGMVGITETMSTDPEGEGGAKYPYRGNVYGGGCGTDKYYANPADETHDGRGTLYNINAGIVRGNTTVLIDGGHVVRDVYGAGSMGAVGGATNGGATNVTIAGNAIIGAENSGGGYVYAAARGALTDPDKATVGSTTLNINGGTIWESAFGGGQNGRVKGNVTVNVTGGVVKNDVYGGGALADTNTDNWDATKSSYAYEVVVGLKLHKEAPDAVTGDDVSGYWTKSGSSYVQASGEAQSGVTYYKQNAITGDWATGTTYKTVVNLTGGIVGNAYGGGLGQLGTGTQYSQSECDTHNAALSGYIASGTVLDADQARLVNNALGLTGAYAYDASSEDVSKKTITSDHAAAYNATLSGFITSGTALTAAQAAAVNADLGTSYTTGQTISIADASAYNLKSPGYRKTTDWKVHPSEGTGNIEAMVYGDVKITVGDPDDSSKGATAFTNKSDTYGSGESAIPIPLTGRVFGCNNLNGTPKGNVTVTVVKTQQIDDFNNFVSGHIPTKLNEKYEVQGVYGGGNLAHYRPAAGKETKVIIDGCEITSISKVFGGGNSASVPSTDVVILGSYSIGYVFGGGNGFDKVKIGDNWYDNDGAPVYGDASAIAVGGKIGDVFSGSDTKGTIYGSATLRIAGKDDTGSYTSSCPLRIVNSYGAGRGADINGDVNFIVSGCTEAGSNIECVYGGSYDANIRGNITLTITSGMFTKVYGGNDHGGTVGGNIEVNIEETDNCNPIIIEHLYGGSNEAAYPGTGARNSSGPVLTGNITVNIKSCTRIDNVYGGSYLAPVNGNTAVNINMIKGYWAEYKYDQAITFPRDEMDITKTDAELIAEYAKEIPNINTISVNKEDKTISCKVTQNSIGSIGNVFGGNNEGKVLGNATVKIGNLETVGILKRDEPGGKIVDEKNHEIYNTDGKLKPNAHVVFVDKTVEGATITGNVYGGGSLADVLKNTKVYICTDNGTSSVSSTSAGVRIDGNVFGGGKGNALLFTCEKAMVGTVDHGYDLDEGNTEVVIGGGSVNGSVFGGGMIARVENNTSVTIGLGAGNSGTKTPEIGGDVFGAGQGIKTHGYSALVRGKSTVTVGGDAWVKGSVYGGGLMASVGRFWVKGTPGATDAPSDLPDGMPYALKDPDPTHKSGTCQVTIKDYAEIGPNDMQMPTFSGHVFGAGKGALPEYHSYTGTDIPERMQIGNSWDPFENEAAYITFIETLGMSAETDVTIQDHAFVKGSVYGGSENGHVLHDTYVKIQDDCQIGNGSGTGRNARFDDWSSEDAADFSECASWPYGLDTNGDGKKDLFAPYDKFADATGKYSDGSSAEGGRPTGSDGHTYYGNVYGGGSGKDPYRPGKWLRSAGNVGGNTKVDITGGHILTSIYGGNEMTDVGLYSNDAVHGTPTVPVSGGKCTINMVDGTLGIPRTPERMIEHPVTCYLFGAGKGDQRIFFNTWTNVIETEVNISGTARIFGSTFGGGEDGHVITNSTTNIGGTVNIDLNGDGDTADEGETFTAQSGLKIGTTGTSYVDGNVFGGGRGYSGTALTAGSIGGNVEVNISGGTMLGSIYGGGRLASVGIDFTPVDDPSYGQLKDETGTDGDPTYGHITINITGGTIGTTTAGDNDPHPVGGNVFGGSMGRIKLLNGDLNPIWPKMAVAKLTDVTINGESVHIMNNVYGGSEYGVVRNRTTVEVKNGTIHGHVFGGGYGSDEQDKTTITAGGYSSVSPDLSYTFTPMIWTGCVSGNTNVNISGGTVKKNVYGGGEFASVGLINFNSSADGKTYNYITKHSSMTDGFGLSWPYEFQFIVGAPHDAENAGGKTLGGTATVTITGGTIGDGDNHGYVFGGSKGQVAFGDFNNIDEQRYVEAFCANVRETKVTISGSPTIRMVYGGGEDGHVMENTSVTINGGTISNSVFGGGKGTSTFKSTLWDPDSEGHNKKDPIDSSKDLVEDVHSWTAGKVYGNTEVTMKAGSVGMFIYGGGNMASVGKGNYAGAADDYSTAGYGETLNEATSATDRTLWDGGNANSLAFLNSGKTTVTIYGGTVGKPDGILVGEDHKGYDDDGVPYGSVFGGSRGKAAASCKLSPRYKYVPDFFLGYTNKSIINIGGTSLSDLDATGPTIHGAVYGGGQDGHVRNSTEVHIFKGNIAGQGSSTDAEGRTGHVFGAGSGIGKFDTGTKDISGDPIMAVNNSSGSVTCKTLVEVSDDGTESHTTIHGNVYGGGAMASVGPPKTPAQSTDEQKAASDGHASYSYSRVDIKGGRIGGSVFAASRGPSDSFRDDNSFDGGAYDASKYATDIWSYLYVTGGTILGNVYGGGEGGVVKHDTEVHLTGGVIGTTSAGGDAFGGGMGTAETAADVGGNTTVKLNEGKTGADKGCVLKRIFGCNDLNGTPKGHASVHVYATQHRDKLAIHDTREGKGATYQKYAKYENCTNKTIEQYDTYLRGLATTYDVALPADYAETIARTEYASLPGDTDEKKQEALEKLKREALDELRGDISDKKYDVIAVYGGGNLAPYEPTSPTELTSVVIDGCELTSIRQVYGGGNAASTPANSLLVNGTYEIDEVYGGGNGKDPYQKENNEGVLKWYQNPGANVGYKDFTELGSETGEDQEHAISQTDKSNALTPEGRKANYAYGSGVATTTVLGGRIHYVYGGSNKRGNICTQALSVYQEAGFCDLDIDDVTGAGKDATTDGEAVLKMDCVSNVKNIYGGSTNADVYNNIVLTITNGTFENVFGGNNTNGAIHGSITVNIEEGGCQPIRIDNLYAGGFKAPYSVYGYEANTSGTTIPKLTGTDPVADPCINVISASYIGNIYGGGYQATVVGNPHVNVNMTKGKVEVVDTGTGYKDNLGKGTTYTVGVNTENISEEVTYYATVNAIRVEVYKVEGTADLDHDGNPDSDYTEPDGGKTYVYKNKAGDTYYKVADVKPKTRYWAVLPIGYIDHNIYGGGNQAEIIGDTHVEIGTGTHHVMSDLDTDPEAAPVAWDPARNRADIRGSVFGGGFGADAYIKGNTYVTMGDGATVGHNIYGGGELGSVGPFRSGDHRDYSFPTGKGVCNVTITGGKVGPDNPESNQGNVYGGGKGHDAADPASVPFMCEEAMAYGTNVSITNGTVTRNVYGGGEIARLENNTVVTIGASGDDTSAPVIKGYVYGGGQGVATHGYSGLARGNSTVTIQGKAKVESSVYGGGEMATMGRYVVVDGLPTTPVAGLGVCTVTVKDKAEIGRDDMTMTAPGGPDDYGHVFGAGRGASPGNYSYADDDKPKQMLNTDVLAPIASDEEYLAFLETLALTGETHVTITGNAFVKGDVFGGSENGRVQTDTHVTISGDCQIGAGFNTSTGKSLAKYTDDQWTAAATAVKAGDAAGIEAAAALMPECAHWPYEAPYAPYDKFANATGDLDKYPDGTSTNGGRRVASDGRTFYGNVFGGGSGFFPYKPGKWHAKAGYVGGNTHLNITGGHILTNAYGGNELSDVAGTCYITMSGGTIGVPRTLTQIAANPVSCYLFGAGQGDPRSFFNSDPATGKNGSVNVSNTEVEVSGGIIYGSVFGGSEDGHVLGNSHVTVKETIDTTDPENPVVTSSPIIGTWGTSYVDGNIFGGGRGFDGLNMEAGNVVGNATIDFQGGTMLGSIYGGGRLASVGTDFSKTETPQNGFFQDDVAPVYYTQSECDEYNTANSLHSGDEGYRTTSDVKTPGVTTGLVTINVSGGTIGNDLEPIQAPDGFKDWTDEQWTTWKTTNHIPNTTFDKETGLAKFAMGGKVYGGSMGRLTKLDGSFNTNWPKLGQVKNTVVNVTGGTIKRDVFGGGETGTVKQNTVVNISGGSIALDVFGGGYGSNDNTLAHQTVLEVDNSGTPMYFVYTPMMFAGCVGGNTYVNVSGGKIGNNIYGGGEMASVGVIDYQADRSGSEPSYVYTYKSNVQHTDKNSSFALSWPWKIAYSDLLEGGSTNVTVTGGRIGTSETGVVGKDNGNIYGGSQGKAGDPHEFAFCGNVKNTYVTINYTGDTPTNDDGTTTPLIMGSVFGGAEDGHVIEDTHLSMKNGLVKHSIFAGGRGQGTYLGTLKRIEGGDAGAAGSDIANVPVRSLTAGKVYGNTYLEMTGGTVWRNVYGGGYMASVGKGNYSGGLDDYATGGYGETITGKLWEHSASFNPNAPISPANVPVTDADYFLSSGRAYLTITGGTVGKLESGLWDGLPSGNVFGSSRGVSAPNITDFTKVSPEYCPDFFSGYVNETFMTIGGDYKCVKPCFDKNGTMHIPGRTLSATQMKNLFTGTAILTGETPSAEFWTPLAGDGPRIYGSVYGGGQDGHVRREAHMIINKGEVGVPYTDENRSTLGTSALSQTKELDDPRWMLRGNLFGAGSGLGQYAFDLNGDRDTTDVGETGYSTSAGSVTHFTLIDVFGGTIHRNVYGGGSLASVGPPPVGSTEITPKGSDPALYGNQSQNIINIYSTVGTPFDTTKGWTYNRTYGGEVYGASRGLTTMDSNLYSTSIWTQVNLFNGATIMGNVYGGGDAGVVKKDTEVNIGDEKP